MFTCTLRNVAALSARRFSLQSCRNKAFQVTNNMDFFEKVVNSDVPVIVNFHAEWCGPCTILTPKLEEIIGPMEQLNLANIDLDTYPEIVGHYEIKAVPAILAFSNGLMVHKFIGLVDMDSIDNLIQKLTLANPPKKTQDGVKNTSNKNDSQNEEKT